MARGRMISQSVALDIEFNKMTLEAQLLFMRAIPHLDRDGLIQGHPVALWAKIAPLLPDLMEMMEDCIQEWLNAGLVILYDSPYGPVIYFCSFSKNQVNMRYEREAESLFPPPPGYYRNGRGLEPLSGPLPVPPPPAAGSNGNGPPSTPNMETDGLRQDSGKTPARLPPNRSKGK